MEKRPRSKFFCKLQLSFVLLATALLACNFWYANLVMQGSEEGGDCLRPSATSGGIGEPARPRPRTPAAKANSPNLDFNFTIAICAIVLDMEAYLSEWLDYHLGAMGIDAVILYDHSPEFHLRSWALNVGGHPLYRRVHVVHWTHEWFPQGEAYRDCAVRFGRGAPATGYERIDIKNKKHMTRERVVRTLGADEGYDYLAFVDGDEFLVPRGKYANVHGVVNDYLAPYGGSLVVNWMLFGSANRTLYSPVPVLRRFQYRDAEANPVVKTIVKASDFEGMRNPHAAKLRDGALVRTTAYPGAVHAEQFPNVSESGATDSSLPSSVLRLHHYRYLSAREYDDKNCRRGHVDGKNVCKKGAGRSLVDAELRGRPSHLALRPGEVHDDSAWRILVDREPRYGTFDDPAWGDYA